MARRDPSGEAQRASVEQLFAEYVDALEQGRTPPFEDYLQRLPGPDERAVFRRLLAEHGDLERAAREEDPGGLPAGTLLGGRYRIVRRHGRGGMGDVYEGFDERLERPVALKALHRAEGAAFDPQGRMRHEALVLARLQHPHIVPVHDVVHDGARPCLVMDLVPGLSLGEVLERVRKDLASRGERAPRQSSLLATALGTEGAADGPSPLGERNWFRAVARLAETIAATLEAAHRAGVLHRDVKPGNVVLRRDGSPVVLDFGLAALRGQALDVAGGGGTPAYLAPEQVQAGRLGDDPRSDVYQAGLLLYELLTLRPAFAAPRPDELSRLIRRGLFLRPRRVDRGIPADLEAICLAAMELDPARRYASPGALAADLSRWLDGLQPPRAARGGRVGSLLRELRYFLRRRRLAASVLAALAAGTLLGVLAWRHLTVPPAETRWFRMDPAGNKIWAVGADDVRLGDKLGIELQTDTPRVIYAVSVFGDPRTYVVPLRKLVVEQGRGQALGEWGVAIDPGRAEVLCTRINSLRKDVPFEGLWVFVCAERDPNIERWLAELQLLSAERGPPRLAWAQQAWMVPPEVVRGGDVAQTEEERRQLAALLAASSLVDDDESLPPGVRRYEMFWRVERE